MTGCFTGNSRHLKEKKERKKMNDIRITETGNEKKKRIAVLFGGCSTEYEVSLQSAHAVWIQTVMNRS